ncbi:protein HEXIM1 [Hyla sarda]|uniref:protein HEXIM1 n=1 Tax=Hyla sarda TaxID=327740 RepID=UPI0024C41904|nr:protein HEXIM1 [Hyla sarda]
MAEVGVQESSLPCKSLAGGGSLLGSQEDSGWQPEEECQRRQPSTPTCPEKSDEGDCDKAGQLSRGKEEEEWKELGKKRHRRRPSKKKRRWKPYNKLTWEEKKRLEERESQRASRIRAEMFAKGQPVAPYNTTQFLMEDHDQEEPDLCPPQARRGPVSLPSLLHANSFPKGDSTEEDAEEEEDGTGSDSDDAGFLQKDFSETYEKYHTESLQDMSKQELVREYLELEKCLSRMEDENNRLRLREISQAASQDGRIRELEMELEKLKEENRRLLRERGQVLAD